MIRCFKPSRTGYLGWVDWSFVVLTTISSRLLRRLTYLLLFSKLASIVITEIDEVVSGNLELFPEEMSDAFNKQIEVIEVYADDSSKENIIKKVKLMLKTVFISVI